MLTDLEVEVTISFTKPCDIMFIGSNTIFIQYYINKFVFKAGWYASPSSQARVVKAYCAMDKTAKYPSIQIHHFCVYYTN